MTVARNVSQPMPSPIAPFTSDEIQRYKRHLVLRDVGGAGQQALKAARVLIIGAGGLGAPLLLYLAAAGVGTIGVVDDDTVSLDNLQRQIVHDTASVGTPKVASAAATLQRINPHVTIEAHPVRLTDANARDLISRYDIVADGSDNFATRYLVSDTCCAAKTPLVYAAVGPFDGYVSTFKPYLANAEGTPNPTYRCLFPEAPPVGLIANCSEVGVLGAVVGIVGTIQATEVLKEIIGLGEGLVGTLLMVDALTMRFDRIRYAWNPDNPLTGRQAPAATTNEPHHER
jgi:molybdopterin-synthase adenylyltransferase